MVVTCPNCRSRYAVDPLKIGPSGRTVECARCHHQWHQKVEAGSVTPEFVIRPTTTGASLPAVIPPKPAFPWRRAVAVGVGFLVMLVIVAAVAYVFRSQLRTMVSDEARVSATTQVAAATPVPDSSVDRGATPEPAARAPTTPEARPEIEIDLPNSSIDAVDGHFVVRGQLVNNGRAPGSTTLLRITFRRDEDVLGERSFPMVEGPLPPGGRTSFNQVIENPPAGTTNIVPAVE